MQQTVRAIYEDEKILRLLDDIDLKIGDTVSITINTFDDRQQELTEQLEYIQGLLLEEAYPGEQAETFDVLKQFLDEDRLSCRKLFS